MKFEAFVYMYIIVSIIMKCEHKIQAIRVFSADL